MSALVRHAFPDLRALPTASCSRCGEALIVFEARPGGKLLCEDCAPRRHRKRPVVYTFFYHGRRRNQRHVS